MNSSFRSYLQHSINVYRKACRSITEFPDAHDIVYLQSTARDELTKIMNLIETAIEDGEAELLPQGENSSVILVWKDEQTPDWLGRMAEGADMPILTSSTR